MSATEVADPREEKLTRHLSMSPFRTLKAVVIRYRVRFSLLLALFIFAAFVILLLSNSVVAHESSQRYENSQDVLYFRFLVFALPLLIGAFFGAPLLASEHESGTFRFAYTQSVGRRRLLLVSVLTHIVVIFCGSILVALSIARFYHYDDQFQSSGAWSIGVFFSQPAILPATVVMAFSFGFLIGGLVRRVVASIAITTGGFAAFVALAYSGLYKRSMAIVARSVMTNDPGATNPKTLKVLGYSSWRAFHSHSTVIQEWVQNRAGNHLGNSLSPAQFAKLHDTKSYTYWLQYVSNGRSTELLMIWSACFLTASALMLTVGLVGEVSRPFSRLGRRIDRRRPRVD
jgi:ABC-type transport system involved in multi-copper enzyme maturation permease subunit